MKSCTYFLVIWSKNSVKSNWVRNELTTVLSEAIQKGTPKIIPVLLDNTPLPQLLSDIAYIRFKAGSEDERGQIITSITDNEPSLNYIKAVVKKYHEVVIDDERTRSGHPLPYKVCPLCGSTQLKGEIAMFYETVIFFINCTECGWQEGTE